MRHGIFSLRTPSCLEISDGRLLSDDYLVRVKAQVMTRDDSTGGWVPMGGGGMSIVGLRKLVISTADDIRHEYLIHGQRIADQSVVLNCVLKKDVQYTKANPTFHHWKTEEKRFGLTFQSSADARAFDKGVKRAVEDLMEGSPDSNANDLEVGDDEVFMTLDLPLGRKDSSSQSASTASTTTSSPTGQSPAVCTLHDSYGIPTPQPHFHSQANHQHLHRVHYIPRHPRQPATSPQSSEKDVTRTLETNGRPEEIWIRSDKMPPQHVKPDGGPNPDDNIEVAMDYSYVQFARNRPSVHEYTYPTLESLNKPPSRRDSLSSLKKHNIEMYSTQPPLPTKSKKRGKGRKKEKKQSRHLLSQRDRCVYCNEMFEADENHRGNCEDAPDKVGDCIEKVACICCARGMLYHCMSDADGDYGHPCVCDATEDNCKRWTALTILSLFVPCLWCYWPLTACHRLGMACGCCGGRHKATK